MKLYKDKQGNKLYPVCSWQANQHKFYNAHDRIMNHIDDLQDAETIDVLELDRAYEQQEEIEHLLEVFSTYVYDGIVYATWADRNRMKDYIGAYDVRHDMSGAWRK